MNWTCPYCDRPQVVTSDNISVAQQSTLGEIAFYMVLITCANIECQRLTLRLSLYEFRGYQQNSNRIVFGTELNDWRLLPSSSSKPQPLYIPKPIRDDYEEACSVRDLSPKASATLARRCLQGMIRDFCGISKNRLVDEINTLRDQVAAGVASQGVLADTVDAIDAVRSIGNIGAHMEKDINVIVDVDPTEAETLIGLIEMLFREWYVNRQQRQDRLAELSRIAGLKQIAKTTGAQKALPSPAIPESQG